MTSQCAVMALATENRRLLIYFTRWHYAMET
jgi:hypothetical protein